MAGNYGTYDPTTNTGSLDQSFLESAQGKEYLRTHPEDAWDIYTGHQYGGTQNFSDNFREFMNQQRKRFIAANQFRTALGGMGATAWGGYGENESPLDYLNTKGYAAASTPESIQRILTGYARIAEQAGNPYQANTKAFIEDPQNQDRLWNLMSWAAPASSVIAPWLQRLGYENAPGRPLGGGKFLDYLANMYATRTY